MAGEGEVKKAHQALTCRHLGCSASDLIPARLLSVYRDRAEQCCCQVISKLISVLHCSKLEQWKSCLVISHNLRS